MEYFLIDKSDNKIIKWVVTRLVPNTIPSLFKIASSLYSFRDKINFSFANSNSKVVILTAMRNSIFVAIPFSIMQPSETIKKLFSTFFSCLLSSLIRKMTNRCVQWTWRKMKKLKHFLLKRKCHKPKPVKNRERKICRSTSIKQKIAKVCTRSHPLR